MTSPSLAVSCTQTTRKSSPEFASSVTDDDSEFERDCARLIRRHQNLESRTADDVPPFVVLRLQRRMSKGRTRAHPAKKPKISVPALQPTQCGQCLAARRREALATVKFLTDDEYVRRRQMHKLRDEMVYEVIPDSEDDTTPPPPPEPSPLNMIQGMGHYWWPLPLPSQEDIKASVHTPAGCMALFRKLGLSFLDFPDSPRPSHAYYRASLPLINLYDHSTDYEMLKRTLLPNQELLKIYLNDSWVDVEPAVGADYHENRLMLSPCGVQAGDLDAGPALCVNRWGYVEALSYWRPA
ncbi:hypothetical protein FB451DRAFT_1184970 [Mycena latifolia]|nr:hypothetical protein FB451DRAFT_1184970 [Mycena latifolia]